MKKASIGVWEIAESMLKEADALDSFQSYDPTPKQGAKIPKPMSDGGKHSASLSMREWSQIVSILEAWDADHPESHADSLVDKIYQALGQRRQK